MYFEGFISECYPCCCFQCLNVAGEMLWTLFIMKTCWETAENEPFLGKICWNYVEILWKLDGKLQPTDTL